jgi:hypothetical protein
MAVTKPITATKLARIEAKLLACALPTREYNTNNRSDPLARTKAAAVIGDILPIGTRPKFVNAKTSGRFSITCSISKLALVTNSVRIMKQYVKTVLTHVMAST